MPSRKKYNRFKLEPPVPTALAAYLHVYSGRDLHQQPPSVPPISAALFGNQRPLVLDIGCGRGEYVVGCAIEDPATNFIGLDRNGKSLLDAVNRAQAAAVPNVRFIRADIAFLLPFIPDAAVQEVSVLFPPPFLTYGHRQRDLLREANLPHLARILVAGGLFSFASDHADYFALKTTLIRQTTPLIEQQASTAIEGGLTRFQRRWEGYGLQTYRVQFQKPIMQEAE